MSYFERTDDSGVLYLASGDNIAVAARNLAAGTRVHVAGHEIKLQSSVNTGHKFAVRPIKAGETVVKYGAPIGSASADIAAGEYVHIHNLQSDYIRSYTLEPVNEQE
jgi:altronate dehydratase